jgi:SPP1 family phage portal protein
MSTAQKVQKIIQENAPIADLRIKWYKRYSTEKLPITDREPPSYLADDATAPDNRLVLSYETEIVDNRANYLLSNPLMVTYKEEGESEEVQNQRSEIIRDFQKSTDFQHLLIETTKFAGSGGASAVVAYLKDNPAGGNPEISLLPAWPWQYVIERNADQTETVSAVRYWYSSGIDDKGNTVYQAHAEYYDKENVYYFKGNQASSIPSASSWPNLKLNTETYPEGKQKHMFNEVPLFELANNNQLRPSFYKVISLIDAQNALHSDFTNEMETFRHAYMMLTNFCGDVDTAKALRDARFISVDDGGDAKYITKEINPEAFITITDQIDKAIERFSGNLNYSDPEVYGRATNLAISTRVKPLENNAKALSLQMDCMLTDMFKVVAAYWSITTKFEWDWKKFAFVYTLDKPVNEVETAEMVAKYREMGLSFETVIEQLPFIKNSKAELERIKEERKEMGFLTPSEDGESFVEEE